MTFWESSDVDFDPTQASAEEMLGDWKGLIRRYGIDRVKERLVVLKTEERNQIRSDYSWPMPSSTWRTLNGSVAFSQRMFFPNSDLFLAIAYFEPRMVTVDPFGSLFMKISVSPPTTILVVPGSTMAEDDQYVFPDVWADRVEICRSDLRSHQFRISMFGESIGVKRRVVQYTSFDEFDTSPGGGELAFFNRHAISAAERGIVMLPVHFDLELDNSISMMNVEKGPLVVSKFLALLASNNWKDIFSGRFTVMIKRTFSIDMFRLLTSRLDALDPTWRIRWLDEDWSARWVLQVSGGGRQDLTLPPAHTPEVAP